METKSIFSPSLKKAIKSLWIFLPIYLIIIFVSNYFYPADDASVFAKLFDLTDSLIACLLFSWYFIINKRWKSLLIVLPLLIIFFLFKDITLDIADYYIPFETYINSKTLRNILYYFLIFITVFLLAKRYLVEEEKQGRLALLWCFLLNLCLLVLYDNGNDVIGQILSGLSADGGFVGFLVSLFYFSMIAIRITAYLGAFYFLMGCIMNKQNIYTFSQGLLRFTNSNYVSTLLIAISCIIFLFSSIVIKDIFYILFVNVESMTIVDWIGLLASLVFFVIATRFVGQLFKYRSTENNKYYGFAGFTAWVPIVNLLSLTLIRFDERISLFSRNNLKTRMIWHLVVTAVFIILLAHKGVFHFETNSLLACSFYIIAIITVSYIKEYNWGFPIILAIVFLAFQLTPFDSQYYAESYFSYFFMALFSVKMILTIILFYGIFYMAFQTLNGHENANDFKRY